MDTSIFLAKAWGVLLIIISLSFLINSKGVAHIFKYMKDEGNIFITGYLTLIIGILSVLAHNIWHGATWVIIVTIFGWIALLKGVVRVSFPYFVARMIKYFEKNMDWMKFFLVLSLGIGIYLLVAAG